MKSLLAFLLVAFSFNASANGDTLEEKCEKSMIYNISIQVAAHPANNDAMKLNLAGAFSSGNWLGLEQSSTERMIAMAKDSESSRLFAHSFQSDPIFAESYRKSFLSGCHADPGKYIVK